MIGPAKQDIRPKWTLEMKEPIHQNRKDGRIKSSEIGEEIIDEHISSGLQTQTIGVETNGLSPGIYFIIIKDNKNAKVQHQKIVVTN